MRYKKSIIFIALLTIFTLPPKSFAVTTPSFPSCANPQGVVKAEYKDGTHGIVGSTETFVGRDAVYTLSDGTLTQCFCSVSGSGIQTDWWKATSLSADEINILESLGWIYIPAGNLWGLEEAPYIAKNSTYNCLPSTTTTTTSSSSSNNGSSTNGLVLGDSTSIEGEVLGMAATGNTRDIVLSFAIGIVLLVIARYRLSHRV